MRVQRGYRPHYVVFPKDTRGYDIDDQYFIGGSGLLVKPVTKMGAEEVQMYLPESQVCMSGVTHYRLLTLILCSRITTTLPTTSTKGAHLVVM